MMKMSSSSLSARWLRIRNLAVGVSVISLLWFWPLQAPSAQEQGAYIELLGTKGGPSLLSPKTLPQSTAIVRGGDIILVDAGYGASYRMIEAGLKLRNIREIYVTHMHSDHVVDYPALLMNSWATGLKTDVKAYGPPGMNNLTQRTWEAFVIDIDKRIEDEGKPDPRKLVSTFEIDEGSISASSFAKVDAIRVHHPPFGPGEAFSYRFRFDGHTIVFTGDVHEFPDAYADFARDADILVAEAAAPEALEALALRVGNGDKNFAKAIMSHHVTPEQIGEIATKANVKKVVLSHLVPADDPSITPEDWIRGVQSTYSGPVVFGHDLMRIDLESGKK